MQMAFYFDQTRCIACMACVTSCKQWHQVPPGPAKWRRVVTTEHGKYPNVTVSFFSTACYNCAEPICVAVCTAQAISKREEDGVVVVDRDKCREAARCGIIKSNGVVRLTTELESPCQVGCPAHLSAPGYVALIAHGRYNEALDLIRERMPLPGVIGRICPAPCETVCPREEVDNPIACAALKRFASDYATDRIPTPIPRTKEERVAIIGSGPAGLAAAYELVRLGYDVTIFEALPVVGGMLVVGIPEYRLPRKVLERDINYIRGLGIEIKTNNALGKDITLDYLPAQGYDATFIAIGAHQGKKLLIPGADIEGTLLGTSFLKDVNMGKKVKIGEKVLVLGGGNVAYDCARTARRLGASHVHIVCLESEKNMPAYPSEIDEGSEEGIVVHPSRTFTRVMSTNGKVSGVECLNLRSMYFDEEGELHIDPIPGSEHVLEADTVIFAVGQSPDTTFLSGARGITITKQGTISVNPKTLETGRPGVFAGGDAVSGPASSIEAIAAGQKAAMSIDSYLQWGIVKHLAVNLVKASDIKVEIPADVQKATRQKMPTLDVVTRITNFDEVALGLTEEMANAEAKRCLNCAGHLCRDVCPYDAPQFGAEDNAKMQKCNFCLDRLAENKKPICIVACITRAMDAGPFDELKNKYGDVKEVDGFRYSQNLKPSVLFKPKTKSRFTPDTNR